MKLKRIFIAIVVVAAVCLAIFWRRGSVLPGATGSVQIDDGVVGRVPSRGVAGAPAEVSGPTTEPEDAGPITATAQITRGDKSVTEAKSLDGEFARMLVAPKEVLNIRLSLNDFDPAQQIRVEVDNGGNLNGQFGSLSLRPSAGESAVDFRYTLGPDRGKYTVFVTHGNRQEQFDFWVGPELPQAKPVPWRDFTPKDSQS